MTLWSAAVTVVGLADFTIESDGDWVTATVTVLDVSLIVPPDGVVPWVVAWSTIEPWSTSAWVTVYVPMKVAT